MFSISEIEPFACPRRCAPLGSLRGRFEQHIDNFWVEEIPSYLPSGDGEHLYVLVRKRNWTTRGLLMHWAKRLSLSKAGLGHAGLKDKRGTTTQWLSLHFGTEEMLPAMAADGVEILEVGRHRNKLRAGHLKGNRFSIAVDGLEDTCVPLVQSMMQELSRWGVPNFYGSQRMGREGNNRGLGRDVVMGKPVHDKWKKKFLISAYQSSLFNDLLAFRMQQGLLDTALQGDLMRKHESGGVFACEHPDVDQPRSDHLEISPTGPIFGYKMAQPQGRPGDWEAALLEREGMSLHHFRTFGKNAKGARRLLRVPLVDPSCRYENKQLVLQFTLPPGSYASVVLHELGIEFS